MQHPDQQRFCLAIVIFTGLPSPDFCLTGKEGGRDGEREEGTEDDDLDNAECAKYFWAESVDNQLVFLTR